MGMAPPPGPPGMGMGMGMPPGPPGMDGSFGGMQRVVEHFESLTLGGGGGAPGSADAVDITTLPRPAGPDRERALVAPAPYDRGNCATHNMRPTVRLGGGGLGFEGLERQRSEQRAE